MRSASKIRHTPCPACPISLTYVCICFLCFSLLPIKVRDNLVSFYKTVISSGRYMTVLFLFD